MLKNYSTSIGAKLSILVIVFVLAIPAVCLAYIGNSNSFKFHKDNCSTAARIKDAHRVDFETRSEAVDAGYVPCKRCTP